MCKHGSIVCKLCPCLPKGLANSARMRTIVATALQRKYLQTELILWILGWSLAIVNKETFISIEKAAKEMGLALNENKTKFMAQNDPVCSFLMHNRSFMNELYNFEVVTSLVDTTQMYFYYATCFGHIGTIIRQFQHMNTTVIEDHQCGSILVWIGHMM
jgi:hypothetical protein